MKNRVQELTMDQERASRRAAKRGRSRLSKSSSCDCRLCRGRDEASDPPPMFWSPIFDLNSHSPLQPHPSGTLSLISGLHHPPPPNQTQHLQPPKPPPQQPIIPPRPSPSQPPTPPQPASPAPPSPVSHSQSNYPAAASYPPPPHPHPPDTPATYPHRSATPENHPPPSTPSS